MGERIESYRDLRVYAKAFELQQRIFEVTKGFPREEIYALTDQLRRSSRSIGANIAEAWHKRKYPAHFISKLTDADGEQAETEHWIDTAHACQYLSAQDRERLLDLTRAIGGMLGKMISEPEGFCGRAEK